MLRPILRESDSAQRLAVVDHPTVNPVTNLRGQNS